MESVKLINTKKIAFKFFYAISLTDRIGCREGRRK